MRKKRDKQLEIVKNLIAQRLDWNLKYAKVMSWKIVDGRLQVILLSKCPIGAELEREYLQTSGALEIAGNSGLDLLIIHDRP